MNCDDFYRFVAIKYKNEFITRQSSELKNKLEINSQEKERNFREIIALILKNRNPDFQYKDFIEHFHICENQKYGRKYTPRTETSTLEKTIPFEYEITTTQLLIEYIKAMSEKYSEEKGKSTCAAFFKTGNEQYITRQNNLRNRIISSRLRETINNLVKQRGISIKDYINEIYPKNVISK